MTRGHSDPALGNARPAGVLRFAALHLLMLLSGPVLGQPAAPTFSDPSLLGDSAPQDAEGATPVRLVVVHWKIKQGQEQEFLDYWAQRSPVADRSGLVGEFLSSVLDRDRFPWINMQAVSASYTSFFNIGIWKNSAAFQDQIGKYIDTSRPSLPFEAERRERVFLQPERWRIGGSALSLSDQPGVK